MPKLERSKEPQGLRLYLQHGVQNLEARPGHKETQADCAFCGGENKCFINQETGQYHCKSCPASGNAYTFIREVHKHSTVPLGELEVVAEERKLDVTTLQAWGLTKSFVDHEWLLPAYSFPGEKPSQICNLYRWALTKNKDGSYKRRLMSSTGFSASLFGFQFWNPKKPLVYITEGPWDGMKLWEVLGKVRLGDNGKLVRSVDKDRCLIQGANIISVPGAETWKDHWEDILVGKRVVLIYDNDHPKLNKTTGILSLPAGYEGLKKAAKKIRSVTPYVSYLPWGPEGYDESLPTGYDLRDFLNNEELVA